MIRDRQIVERPLKWSFCSGTCTGWTFVHNYIELPAPILRKFEEIRGAQTDRALTLFGKEQFEKHLFELDSDGIEELIGDAATDEDFRALQPAEVLRVVADIMAAVNLTGVADDQTFRSGQFATAPSKSDWTFVTAVFMAASVALIPANDKIHAS